VALVTTRKEDINDRGGKKKGRKEVNIRGKHTFIPLWTFEV
jgi:hypothetical protein